MAWRHPRANVQHVPLNAAGQKVFQRWYDQQAFRAGQTRTFQQTWSVPATAAVGPYTIKIGIFSPGWGGFLAWNNNAGQFSVS